MRLGVNNPVYVGLLAIHVGLGVIGYGSNAVGGWFAARARRGVVDEGLRRFLGDRISLAQWCVVLVPVAGILLLAEGNLSDAGRGWFIGAVGIWALTAVVLASRGWPAQRRITRELAGAAPDLQVIRSSATAMLRSQQLVTLLYSLAFALMLFKP